MSADNAKRTLAHPKHKHPFPDTLFSDYVKIICDFSPPKIGLFSRLLCSNNHMCVCDCVYYC